VEGEKMAPTFPSNFENGAKYSLKLSLKILITFPSFPQVLRDVPHFTHPNKIENNEKKVVMQS
jgi:hypothetical protein